MIFTPTCTSSILQEDLKNFVDRASIISDCNVIFADVDHYQVNEIQAADRTLEQVVRYYLEKSHTLDQFVTDAPSVNIIGILTLGFHNRHDCHELRHLLKDLDIRIN